MATMLSSPSRTQVKVGSYTGDGTAYHIITDVGFYPSLIWIWTANQYAVWSSPIISGNKTLYFAYAAAGFTNGITGFLPNGFTIGSDATVNTNGVTYQYIAFRDNGDGLIDVGSYTGNGTDNTSITSPGFQPDFVHVKGDTTQVGCYRHSNSPSDTTYLFSGLTASDLIQQLVPPGFQIGADARVNSNGVTYYYFAFKKNKDFFEIQRYSGTGANDYMLNLIFTPVVAMVQRVTGGTTAPVYSTVNTAPSGTSMLFSNSASLSDSIIGISPQAMFLGTNIAVNNNSSTYDYFIWKNISISDYAYKSYVYKVYNNDVYVTSWSAEVIDDPSFRNVVNSGPGELVIRLARQFDSFGENVDVRLNNRIDLWCYNRENPNGTLLYRGFISGYRPIIDEHQEYVELTILSYVFELEYYMLRDGSGATTITYTNMDVADILKDILQKYRADGGTINYTADSIQSTGNVLTYTFVHNTVREAIDLVIQLAPLGWWWTVDTASIIYLKPKSAVADHTFIISKHISHLETWRRVEDVVNRVYLTGRTTTSGTGLYRVYSDSGSIGSYGLHAIRSVDPRVTNTVSADYEANRILDIKSDPEIRTVLKIMGTHGQNKYQGYNLESILPGQTMRISNLKTGTKTYSRWDQFTWDTDVWDQTLTSSAADVIQILSVDYTPDFVNIEASSRLPEIAKLVNQIERRLIDYQVINDPNSPTAA
jgi:hypothetical protein